MRKIIYPYKMGSGSGRQLASRLNAIRVYADGNYCYREGDLVINWGNSIIPDWNRENVKWLNNPICVKKASNKLSTLKILQESGINIPRFETARQAVNWGRVVVRHKLNGHSGEGIEIVDYPNLPPAPLYTQFISSKAEYRVHIFDGKIIDYAKKVWLPDLEEADFCELDCSSLEPTTEQRQIRSHRNGWVFVRDRLALLPRIGKIALQSIRALELDFGAVDIILNEVGTPYVLEVNTAVGMETTTENNYTVAFLNKEIDLLGKL